MIPAPLRHPAVPRYLRTNVGYSQGPGSTVQLPGQTVQKQLATAFFKNHIVGGGGGRERRFQVLKFVTQNFGVRAGSQQCSEAGDVCAICQAQFRDPVALLCQVRRGRGSMNEVQQDYSAPCSSRSHCKQRRSCPSTPWTTLGLSALRDTS